MADRDSPWQRDGLNIEELPDPFAPPADHAPPPIRRKRGWIRMGFTAVGALLLITILWLVITAPLGRALEPLPDPAMLLLSAEGKPIARRGAIKDRPVQVAELDRFTPAAFVAVTEVIARAGWTCPVTVAFCI